MRLRSFAAAWVFVFPVLSLAQVPTEPAADGIISLLREHQFDLSSTGTTFLLNEARKSSFFLLGELHGETEIPDLLHALWPEMKNAGYTRIAAEISPWAARELEFGVGKPDDLLVLWLRRDARFVHLPAAGARSTVWGCDMEEGQPDRLIRELGGLNPANTVLKQMIETVTPGYRRNLAPQLLAQAERSGAVKDELIDGISLRENLLDTLRIEALRLNPDTRYEASVTREAVMKKLFLAHYQRGQQTKVMLRFGRNHLHRGYDARGVSTLGNFVAEFAASKGITSFHVGAFAAGGQEKLLGHLEDADERGDEAAFQFLASIASYPASVFDLRPLRPVLHRIPAEKRSPLERNLVYWADSYDAIICYQRATPLN